MFKKNDKKIIYWLLDRYLKRKINGLDFANKFHLIRQLDLMGLTMAEDKLFSELSIFTDRFTPFKEDVLQYPGTYFTDDQLREKVLEIKNQLFSEWNISLNTDNQNFDTPSDSLMNKIQTFTISNDKEISIYMPDLDRKVNWYYKPTEKLNKFDEAIVIYCDIEKNKTVTLTVDIIGYILNAFTNKMEELINFNLQIPRAIHIGTMGYFFNEAIYSQKHAIVQGLDFNPYWFFSYKGTEAWVYNKDDGIYIEISPSWKWLYLEENQAELDYIPYSEFIENYKPFVLELISTQQARQWLEMSKKTLQQIEK